MEAKTWQETVIQQRYPLANHEEQLDQLQKQAEITWDAAYAAGKLEGRWLRKQRERGVGKDVSVPVL